MTDLSRIGVVGAGQMGRGITHGCALAGLDVILADVNADVLSRSLETIDANLGQAADITGFPGNIGNIGPLAGRQKLEGHH